MSATVHKPFPDDGIMYCGWDGHEGCGEVWPCSTVRSERAANENSSPSPAGLSTDAKGDHGAGELHV